MIRVDDSEFPLVTVTFDGASTDTDMEGFLNNLDACMERAFDTKLRVGYVMDTRTGLTSSASQRRMMGEWLKTHDLATRATCAGLAFVMPSAIMRGALTAILWIAPLPADHTITAEVGDARAWMRERLSHAEPVAEQRAAV